MTTAQTAVLTVEGKEIELPIYVEGKEIELPIYKGTLGPDVLDISKLGEQGFFTYDPGFMSTASCESKITYIDGDKGILLHRGYPIEELAAHADYMEVCYLMLYGELPTNEQKAAILDEQNLT